MSTKKYPDLPRIEFITTSCCCCPPAWYRGRGQARLDGLPELHQLGSPVPEHPFSQEHKYRIRFYHNGVELLGTDTWYDGSYLHQLCLQEGDEVGVLTSLIDGIAGRVRKRKGKFEASISLYAGGQELDLDIYPTNGEKMHRVSVTF